jgi:isopenicillin N synthase-like dioxygenase
VAVDYHKALEQVLHALNDMSAAALDLAPGFFDRFHAPADCSLRLAHYPPSGADAAAGALRYGSHSDYGGFTILLQDAADEGQADAGGLEVQAPDREAWIAATLAVGVKVIFALPCKFYREDHLRNIQGASERLWRPRLC